MLWVAEGHSLAPLKDARSSIYWSSQIGYIPAITVCQAVRIEYLILLLTLAETKGNDLLSLRWPSPPRNILLVKKENTLATTEAVVDFAKYAQRSRPSPQDSGADR